MTISRKQEQAIHRLTAYTTFAWPCDEAIAAFFRVTDLGESPWYAYGLEKQAALEFKDLLDAHTIQSRQPSAILEGLWINGLADYPIRLVVRDYIRDGYGNPDGWFRKLPAYIRAYELSVHLHAR